LYDFFPEDLAVEEADPLAVGAGVVDPLGAEEEEAEYYLGFVDYL
jgi:hypothetical protein